MFFVSLLRIGKTAMVSLWRNRWLSLASVMVMIITLIIISVFVSLTVITNRVTKELEEKIDMAAYIEDDVSTDQIFALQKMLSKRSEVLSVYYVSKEEALNRWRDRNKDNENIRDVISESDNPLPRSLEVKTKTPADLEGIARILDNQEYSPLVKELSYKKNKDLIDRLIRIAYFIKTAGWVLSTVFILISILVIYNTIRLTIFARGEEIEIMKLVGATDWYIRGPFVIEGVSYGIIGTVISSLILYFVFQLVLPVSRSYLGGFDLGEGYLGVNYIMVVLMQFLVGIVLGFSCSILAIKKHLKE